MLSEKQLELIKNQKYVVLATADLNNQPRVIFVEVNKIENDTIIITDNFMFETLTNIKENNKVFVLAFEEGYEHILNITGHVTYRDSGELMEYVKKENEGFNPKGVLEIKITDVKEKTYKDL